MMTGVGCGTDVPDSARGCGSGSLLIGVGLCLLGFVAPPLFALAAMFLIVGYLSLKRAVSLAQPNLLDEKIRRLRARIEEVSRRLQLERLAQRSSCQ